MANDELRKEKREAEFFERLFGEVTELSDEELDLLYAALAPGESPTETICGLAERAAMEYRKRGKVPPEHVQAALDATRPDACLKGTKPSFREKLAAAFTGPVSDPVFGYRHLKEVTANDKAILDSLSGELQEDWDEGEHK
jgi:hypothetical protein